MKEERKKTNTTKVTSTFDEMMKKTSFKKKFDTSYKDFVLSELVLAIMEEDDKSIRGLAEELGISKTIIQNIRSGVQKDIKLSNFIKFTESYGYKIVLEKEDSRITLQ
jgi:hypothetical protein